MKKINNGVNDEPKTTETPDSHRAVHGNDSSGSHAGLCSTGGAERSSNTMPGYEELLGDRLHSVSGKMRSSDPAAVPDGYKMGLLQTVTDQKNGRDTGYTWGYIENDSSIIYGKRDTNPSSLEAGLRYMSDKIEYDPDASGITYQFEMPEGERTYQVTLGCKIPGIRDRQILPWKVRR